ncbi:hypothetical protein V2J09_004983 [Rumex salicifolius]
MESSMLVQEFEEIPSPEEFSARIESRNAPAVFRRCVEDWIALTSWNPSTGGLDYLQDKVGSSVVEGMVSSSAPIFYGDIRRHERVEIAFSTFIGLCKQHSQSKGEPEVHLCESDDPNPDDEDCSSFIEGASNQIYLAQVPILISDNEERVQLDVLRGDIKIPSLLGTKKLASINLWMNNHRSRSSTHYDPHHNLLCIVAGCKHGFPLSFPPSLTCCLLFASHKNAAVAIVLWPPSASPLLYLMPIYSEASNHSSVPLDRPDFSIYPRSRLAAGYSQKITLQEGDALFIPEGWLHQVDSDDLTIAVNFWWRSDIMSSMIDHMDAYYLRRLLRRLIDKEMSEILFMPLKLIMLVIGQNQMLQQSSEGGSEDLTLISNDNSEENKVPGNKTFCGSPSWNVGLDDLAPPAIRVLHELIGLVHDQINPTDTMVELTSTADLACKQSKGCMKLEVANMYNLDNDPVAKIIWNLDAFTLQTMLLVMVHKFPRTLEALILHLLSPVGAEALTRKFEEMDKKVDEDDRSKFYQLFYSIFGDHFSAADIILRRKESFAHQVIMRIFFFFFCGIMWARYKLTHI